MKFPSFSSRLSRCLAAGTFLGLTLVVPMTGKADGNSGPDLWKLDNLYPWCMVPYDGMHRGPEDRAALLNKLGFTQFVYDWRENNVPEFDTEIETLQKHNIKLLGWWFPGSAEDPHAKLILDAFKRHNVHPQLWIVAGGDWTHTPDEQTNQVNAVADRMNAIVKMAQPYGCAVELYNHNGWSGSEDNELAIIARLKELGTTGVGMVYNFSHAHDADHNDITDFPAIWARIKPYVVAVNLTGMGSPWQHEIWPSQGEHEVAMMKTIQDSGWSGPVGLICENGGGQVDAEVNLTSELKGLAWCAAEIKQEGSGGPRPFALFADPKPFVPGKFGQAMNMTAEGVTLANRDELRQPPITVEMWAKLRTDSSPSILVASDPKSSSQHWEVFAEGGTGNLACYLPGMGGLTQSTQSITDDQWHYIAMVLEPNRVRLYIDAQQVADAPVTPAQGTPNPGDLAIGQLAEGGLGCAGAIQEVKISKGAKAITSVPTAPLASDATTLGFWALDTKPDHG